jgi:hypothetical protein
MELLWACVLPYYTFKCIPRLLHQKTNVLPDLIDKSIWSIWPNDLIGFDNLWSIWYPIEGI